MKKASQHQQDLKNTSMMHFETQSLQSFIFARQVVLKEVWNFEQFRERNFILLGSLAKKYETPCFSVILDDEWLCA